MGTALKKIFLSDIIILSGTPKNPSPWTVMSDDILNKAKAPAGGKSQSFSSYLDVNL